MNKFMKLPLVQRLLIVAIVAAAAGGAGYYFLIVPGKAAISAEVVKYEYSMKEYATLRTYDTPEFMANLEKEQIAYKKLEEAYRKMLPPRDEIPALIESLKKQADDADLSMTILDQGKAIEEGPGYRGIAFDVEMVGTYQATVSFLAGLSGTAKRIINAKELKIHAAPSDQLQKTAGDVGRLRVLLEREAARGLTPNEKYAKSVALFDDIARRRLMKVNFTAVAYVDTTARAPGAK